ncbi:hypothetical protein HAX54_052745 [Datura stramonium]|uniref:Uncharacterized protein n=1 Tax=Datura stramonium TaxID=4076 RepID=A0ABS8SZE1_DATST|nr:hypothetical protein [Datura stramonium]
MHDKLHSCGSAVLVLIWGSDPAGESSLVHEAESQPPHKVDENLWKNREQLEEILFLLESTNWPPVLQLQSTAEDAELVSVLGRLGEKFRSTLKSLETFQSKNSEFVFNTGWSFYAS